MQLKYSKTVYNKVIIMDLETVNFTEPEKAAIERFGDPIVKISKNYGPGDKFPVLIERKLMSSFKIRQKFDGTADINMDAAVTAANTFYAEVIALLGTTMSGIMEQYRDLNIDFQVGDGIADIPYV